MTNKRPLDEQNATDASNKMHCYENEKIVTLEQTTCIKPLEHIKPGKINELRILKDIPKEMLETVLNKCGDGILKIKLVGSTSPDFLEMIGDKCKNLIRLEMYKAAGSDMSALSKTSLARLKMYCCSATEITGIDTCASLTHLHLYDVNITLLNKLPSSLKHVFIYSNTLTDIGGLASCKSVEQLTLSAKTLTNIDAISSCTSLRHLEILCKNVTDITAISNCILMITLNVNCDKLNDIRPISDCAFLQKLKVSADLSDIRVLSRCKQLRYLNLGYNNISDIGIIPIFKSLDTLDISNNNVRDISALKSSKLLQQLECGCNRIEDISALANCTALKHLDIRNNKIKDISAFANCKALQCLYACYNELDSISVLETCKNLFRLDISHNQVTDLVACDSLTYLDASNNKLTTVNTLGELLTHLNLSHNMIENTDALAVCKSLSVCNISYNKIAHLTSLVHCKLLTSLDFSYNRVKHLDQLPDCKILQHMNTSYNPIIVTIQTYMTSPALKSINFSGQSDRDTIMLKNHKTLFKYIQ